MNRRDGKALSSGVLDILVVPDLVEVATMPNPYHVRLAISQYGDQFRAELFTEDLGDTDGDLLPVKWEVLDEWLPYLSQGAAGLPPDAARKVGKQLFEYLLGKAENSKKWTEILEQVKRQRRPLRLLIDATTEAVRDLPYGLLCEPHDDYYLLRPAKGHESIQFLRILRRCTPRTLTLGKPIRVLLAAAEPQAAEAHRFGCATRLCEMARGMTGTLEVMVCSPGGVQRVGDVISEPVQDWKPDHFDKFCRLTRDGLQSALKGSKFDILHLIAHGQGNSLLLCDVAGGKTEVTASELGEWCGESKLQMAFLQVCKGSQTGERGGFGGLAQQLLNPRYGNLAAVVASPYPLDAERSTPAAIAFYQRLANGDSPDAALDRGLEETNWTWAFLELWVRPSALGDTGTRGAFQFVSPYRGLARFEERDADIFFGRDAEVGELLEILKTDQVATVVGDSGSGKSSLLQAGLAHRVRQHGLADRTGWRIVSLHPGQQPGRNLMASLDEGDFAADLAAPEDWFRALDALLKRACSAEGPLLVLFDQFEEMFTLCDDKAQRGAVAKALAQPRPGHFRLVLGMRSDYLGSAIALPGLTNLVKRPWVLRPPGPDNIRAIVAKPAESCGYRFQGALSDSDARHAQGLLERIWGDPLLSTSASATATASPSSPKASAPLPLLEFALERLWLMAVGRGAREFAHSDYDQLGGLGGAIAGHAEEAYQLLPASLQFGAESQSLAERIFTGLINSQGTRRPRPRGDLETESGNSALARRVIDHLVGERLLTIRSEPNNPAMAQVDIAHEVLINRWDRLKGWLAQDPEGRALKEEFQKDAERWDRGLGGTPPRSRKNLPGPDLASGYLTWIQKSKATLPEAQKAYAEALRVFLRRRKQLLISGVAAVLVVAVVWTGLALFAWNEAREVEENARGRALAQVESLLNADPQAVPNIIEDLKHFRHWVDPTLRERRSQPALTERHRTRASLALLSLDPGQVSYLRDRMLEETEPREMLLIRDSLAPHRGELMQDLWSLVDDPKAAPERKFRALVALADFDPRNNHWATAGAKVVNQFLMANPLHLGSWTDAMRPVRDSLLDPLARVFRDTDQVENRRIAATVLADYAADQPDLLADLVKDADAPQYGVLLAKLQPHRDRAIVLMHQELAKTPPSEASEDVKDTLAKRQANAAVALVQLGQAGPLWPLLRHNPDPRLRTYLIHRLALLGAEPQTLVRRLDKEPDVSARRALILCLGEFPDARFPADDRQPLVGKLLLAYREDPDSGIHSAADWLLRRWRYGTKLREIDEGLMKKQSIGDRGWYVNGQGQTLAVIRGPMEFLMGSPIGEPDRFESEVLHRKRIPRTFAIATKEVTVQQFLRFRPHHKFSKNFSPASDAPITNVTWYEAAQYCRWLCEQEGIPEDQMCYPPVHEITQGLVLPPHYLSRTGYRLPTEAEWEYACRAGAVTPRFYGASEDMLGNYAWYIGNSRDHAWPVGKLKPNDLGLFDVYGNVLELCQDPWANEPYHPASGGQASEDSEFDSDPADKERHRHVRGGSFHLPASLARSAHRLAYLPSVRMNPVGLRVVRTIMGTN
jgi:formylglycine-generating enzyme required for sulfatase activity